MAVGDLTIGQQYLKAKGDRRLFYSYLQSKIFCSNIELIWLGDDWIAATDQSMWELAFTQEQVDMAMRHHLWTTKRLFTPKTYRWRQRLILAFFFLSGWKPK